MEAGAIFIATLSAILLILLITSTLRWWRNRIKGLTHDIAEINNNSNNNTNNDDWIFSIVRGTDRQLIRYSTDERNYHPAGHTNCRHYANGGEKTVDDTKGNDGLPSYEEAMKAQQQHDLKLVNSNAALSGSVV